jgi:hypothetical protein
MMIQDHAKTVQDQADDLIKQGKSNDEIFQTLNGTKLKDKHGDTTLFPAPMMKEQYGFGTDVRAQMQGQQQTQEMKNIVQQGFADIPVAPLRPGAVYQSPQAKQQGLNVLEKGGAQPRPTPQEAAYEILKPVLPFSPLVEAFRGNPEATEPLNPIPIEGQKIIRGAVEGLNKFDKVVEDYTNWNPGLGKQQLIL